MRAFERKADRLSLEAIERAHEAKWIDEFFLPKDSNSLSFERFNQGFYDKPEPIIQYFQAHFFKNYEGEKLTRKVEDSYLVQEFSNALKSFSPAKRRLIQPNYKLHTALVETVFDFGWQNGSTNLVKSLSFDLKRKDSIQNKAVRWYGEIAQFSQKANEEHLRFDFLVYEPQDKALFSAYEKALKIIDGLAAPTHIVERQGLEAYVEKVVEMG